LNNNPFYNHTHTLRKIDLLAYATPKQGKTPYPATPATAAFSTPSEGPNDANSPTFDDSSPLNDSDRLQTSESQSNEADLQSPTTITPHHKSHIDHSEDNGHGLSHGEIRTAHHAEKIAERAEMHALHPHHNHTQSSPEKTHIAITDDSGTEGEGGSENAKLSEQGKLSIISR
jgi:hypothetical protein